MRTVSTVILAVLLLITSATADVRVDPPLRVQFRLADGIRITGTLTSWNSESFDGSFGTRRWLALDPDDLWSLYRRVMNQSSSDDWINLGRLLLLSANAPKSASQNAQSAFRRAREIDPQNAPAAIQSVLDEVDAAHQSTRETHQAALEQQLATISPEAAEYSSNPWPALSANDQITALASVLLRSETMLRSQGLSLKTVQSPFFLIYSDLPPSQINLISADLDRAYKNLADLFQLPAGANIFYGKAVVFIFRDPDRFHLVETSLFQQLVPRAVTAVCHPGDPDLASVFICATSPDPSAPPASAPAATQNDSEPAPASAPGFYEPGASSKVLPSETLDADLCRAAIVRESVHAFLHRYRSPKRLPAWANEGLAWYIAEKSMKSSPVDKLLRAQGRKFIRSDGPVSVIFDVTYQDLATAPAPGSSNAVNTSASPAPPIATENPNSHHTRKAGELSPEELARRNLQKCIAAANLHSVGYLAVALMLQNQSQGFANWVNAIKAGKDWESALASSFGTPRERLADIVTQYFRVND
ncbi:MAG TPA: hypothetical protein VG711_03855 [Phycisphaerales bacterium]|nr:hypothetical protein [Phycisphaerales bacterium]